MSILCQTTKEKFYEYIYDKELLEKQGDVFHSTNYINKKGEIVAYREWSSWGSGDIFMIKPNYINQETTDVITSLIQNKSN